MTVLLEQSGGQNSAYRSSCLQIYCLLITRELSRGGSNRNAEREYFYGYAVGRDLFAQVRMGRLTHRRRGCCFSDLVKPQSRASAHFTSLISAVTSSSQRFVSAVS
jgi:hypothetical protein